VSAANGNAVLDFLKCGDLREGFARVRCPDCRHEFFVAFSCKQRCVCPSCHQKRSLTTAQRIAEEVSAPVPQQVARPARQSCGLRRASAGSAGHRRR
jgi:ribosomal protein S27E